MEIEMNRKFILASRSPRRIEILRKHGIEPVTMPADIDETLPDGISPRDAVMFLAYKKACAAEAGLLQEDPKPNSLILAADTVVCADGKILGKPKDAEDAFRMLTMLRGRWHYVATGAALIDAGTTHRQVLCDLTKVFVNHPSDEELRAYISTGEPFDKAGAYAIQGGFGKYIDHIEGSYENVVGLPWPSVEKMLAAFDK